MSGEEKVCDNQGNSSITTTPSRSVSDSDHDTSSTISSKASIRNQISEKYFSFDEPSSNMNLFQKPITNNPTINENVEQSCEKYFGDINNKPLITPTSSKMTNDQINKKKTILSISSCRIQKPEFFFSFDDESSCVDNRLQSPTKTDQNYTLKQNIDKLQNIEINEIITGRGAFYNKTLQKKTSNQQVNAYRTYVSMEGQETIDFLNQFTKNVNINPILEGIISYLSYNDIASMISVSNIWQKAIINSTVAQKKMETIFIQGILYFCHGDVNISDEHKYLFENILFDLKKHLQFNQEKPSPSDFSEK